MSAGDAVGLVIGYAFGFGLLLGVERLRSRWPLWLTRKLAHVGAGMLVWGMLLLFDHWYVGVVPFASFILLNYVFHRRQTFRAVSDASSSLGTVYFSISVTLLFALLWRPGQPDDRAPIAAAAVMAMTWGDAAAALTGHRFGTHTYRVLGETRSVEGSIAMLIVSFVAIAVTLLILEGPARLSWAATAALVATIAEAISPRGTDNLSVPLSVALVLL